MGVGPQGLHDVLDPGEVLGQLGDLGAVAEDGHGSFDLPLPPQGDAVGEDGDVGDGLQADVVLRLAVCITGMVEWG